MSSSPKHSSSAQEAIETAALHWLLEREEGFQPDRAREFAAWCAANPQHEAELAKAETAMELFAEIPRARHRLRPTPTVPFEPQSFQPPAPAFSRRLLAWIGGMAAMLALTSLAWWGWIAWGTADSDALHLMTEAGSPQLVALNDGSLVDVNSNSALKVRMLPTEREIELSAGEAHFEVAHDAARPFIVKAGGVTVRAIGTAFTVSVREDVVEVLVVEGRVEVSRTSLLPTRKFPATAPLVVAHERVRVDRGDKAKAPVVEPVDAQAVQAALAWHTQITNFANLPLGQIITLFNRRNVTQLVLADEELATRRIGGAFAIDRPLAFVRVLERDGDILAERRGDHNIVLRRAR